MQIYTVLDASNGAEESIGALKTLWESFWPDALKFVIDLAIGILILIVGRLIVKLIIKMVRKILERTEADPGVSGFIQSLLKFSLYIVLIVIIAGAIGIPTASLIAVLGSAGLAVGLALQGSLSNFAGGVLILLLKPFRIGDFIDTSSGAGTVTSIDIFYTKLCTPDNRVIVIPNGTLSNSSITNVTKEVTRRIDLTIPVSYQDDIVKVKNLLQGLADELSDKLIPEQPVDIWINNFGSDAVEFTYRLWVKAEDYWPVRAVVMERVKTIFDKNGVSIPFSQLDVHIQENK